MTAIWTAVTSPVMLLQPFRTSDGFVPVIEYPIHSKTAAGADENKNTCAHQLDASMTEYAMNLALVIWPIAAIITCQLLRTISGVLSGKHRTFGEEVACNCCIGQTKDRLPSIRKGVM
jgi:hypothetical protein